MAPSNTMPDPPDPMDFFPYRGQYGGAPTGAFLFVSVRATLPLLFYSLLAPPTSPLSLFAKFPWAAPSHPPPTASSLPFPGLPDALLSTFNNVLGLSSSASLIFLGVTLSSFSFTAYNLLWRRERLPMTGQGGAVQITTQVNFFDAVHAFLFVFLAARNPTWSPGLFRWTPVFFVAGLGLHVLADHSKYLFRKDPRNRNRVYTGSVWGVVRHPNFLGFTFWRTAFACAAGGWAFGLFMAGSFGYLFWNTSVPALERYMAGKYGKDWERVKEKVPSKMVPGVW